MKKILLLAIMFGCVYLGCKHTPKTSYTGVYKLDKLTVSGGGKDSVYTRTQIKIYTDGYFVYASLAPDSSVGFGVGSYKLDTGNMIVESNVYSSRSLDSQQMFHIKITTTGNGYTQVIPAMATVKGVTYSETEVYTKIASSGTSTLDGVWKLDSAYTVKGKDTIKQTEVQFKAFWGGHFIFVHRYSLDNTKTNFKNGFGYGDFTFKNDTLSEEDSLTNHTVLLNKQFAIKIDMHGSDQYRQVIHDAKTGEQSVEVYRRLK